MAKQNHTFAYTCATIVVKYHRKYCGGGSSLTLNFTDKSLQLELLKCGHSTKGEHAAANIFIDIASGSVVDAYHYWRLRKYSCPFSFSAFSSFSSSNIFISAFSSCPLQNYNSYLTCVSVLHGFLQKQYPQSYYCLIMAKSKVQNHRTKRSD